MSPRDRDCAARAPRLLAIRPGVVAATRAAAPCMSTAATLEAVDDALWELVRAEGYRRDADQVRAAWITMARRRLIDEQRSARTPAARRNDRRAER